MRLAVRGLPTLLGLALCSGVMAQPCPGDATSRASTTLLTVQVDDDPVRAHDSASLLALPVVTLTQQQRVTSSAGAGADSERSIRYGGTLLREVLLQAGFGGPQDRGARPAVIEAVASDGYRAVFSWGEVFNTALGEQILVVVQQDGRALDPAAGPLALRSIGDLRPGPRHVRNLCALRVRRTR